MKEAERAKLVDEALQLVWKSLVSHLDFTGRHHKKVAKMRQTETRAFHQECVQEYSRLITILSKLY